MSKPIRSYKESERRRVAERRIASNIKGCGYWSAVDFLNKAKPLQGAK